MQAVYEGLEEVHCAENIFPDRGNCETSCARPPFERPRVASRTMMVDLTRNRSRGNSNSRRTGPPPHPDSRLALRAQQEWTIGIRSLMSAARCKPQCFRFDWPYREIGQLRNAPIEKRFVRYHRRSAVWVDRI